MADLFWWMSGGAGVVWLLAMAFSLHAVRRNPDPDHDQQSARKIVLWAGVIVPTLLLTALLIYGLSMLPPLVAQAPRERGTVHVTGEQWWWRVRYEPVQGQAFELANELRIPLGARMPVSLDARDVIHSFWVPAITGKRDMIPGRVTQLALEADRVGTYLGACAEFCGAAHAQMRLHLVVLEPRDYEEWLAQQQRAAEPAQGALAQLGERTFQKVGCGACHTIRGTPARGTVGPDLTHVGGRTAIAAAVLPNDVAAFERWLTRTKQLKPAVHMPSYAALGTQELRALATYLKGLR